MKLKLIKGRSYNAKGIKVGIDKPIFETSDTALADKLVRSGYFTVISAESEKDVSSTPTEKMTAEQLDKYADENGIDLTGCKNKAEKLAKIQDCLKTEGGESGNINANFDDEV